VTKRLTLVISSLFSGGAERVMSIMANYWADKNWQITVITFDSGLEQPFYKLHPGVVHVALGIASTSKSARQAFAANLERIRILRRAIRQSRPNAVISFLDTTNVLALLATRGTRAPVVVSERSEPRFAPITRPWAVLRRLCYPFAKCIVVQSESVGSFFPPSLQPQIRVVPNPVLKPPPALARKPCARKKRVIAIGRLTPEKGFDMLLRAFAMLASRHAEWTLAIWGEGIQRAELEDIRDKFGLQGQVRLPGRTCDPHKELRQADLFVLSSRFEGFPNVLGEAMACGLPVISFDCSSGPREIIRHGVDGILVPPGNIELLAASMDRLMSDEAERARLGTRAPEVLQRFDLEKVMRMWSEVLKCATNGGLG